MKYEIAEASVDAVHATYRSEVAKLKMQLVLYRKALLDAGIEPPDHDGEELLAMLRDCNAVISTTATFVQHLGSAHELLWELP